MKKLRIGWFSFSCCEDSTIVFSELLNEHWNEWKEIFEICAARVLQKKSDITNLDIAFVEGAILKANDKKDLKKIRKNSKLLVAIGSCACNGMPSTQRNMFSPELKKEIQKEVKLYNLLKDAVPLEKVVKVDAKVPGCPMNEMIFLQTVAGAVKQLQGGK